MEKQQVDYQQGEIEFRRKLFQQQVREDTQFRDEFDSHGIRDVLAERMQKTLSKLSRLQSSGIPLFLFVEIGAERRQRSLVMETDLGSIGASVDISIDMLKSCTHYQEVFSKPREPFSDCCDASNLPIRAGSIPLVICYEMFHHFPGPLSVVKDFVIKLFPKVLNGMSHGWITCSRAICLARSLKSRIPMTGELVDSCQTRSSYNSS